ncbi:MAG: hypothetical protein ACRDNF_20880 [Streptosporangiaceae bacterium]
MPTVSLRRTPHRDHLVTAAVVGARLTGSLRAKPKPHSDHVVVVGLGTRIAGQLHDLGVDVVCVDDHENPPGAGMARRLGRPPDSPGTCLNLR